MLREYWSFIYILIAMSILTLGVISPPYELSFLISMSGLVPLTMLGAGIIGTCYMLFDSARNSISRYLLIAIALSLAILPVILFIAPSAFGLLINVLPGDIALLTLGGTMLMIAALEQPYSQNFFLPSLHDLKIKLHKPSINMRAVHKRSIFDLLDFRLKTEP